MVQDAHPSLNTRTAVVSCVKLAHVPRGRCHPYAPIVRVGGVELRVPLRKLGPRQVSLTEPAPFTPTPSFDFFAAFALTVTLLGQTICLGGLQCAFRARVPYLSSSRSSKREAGRGEGNSLPLGLLG
jgi:hypothetical protein